MEYMKGFFKRFGRRDKEGINSAAHEGLRLRYEAFRRLLTENNAVLEHMADMEEKLSGEYLFDRNYIYSRVEEISAGVSRIISHLNELSSGKYEGLRKAHAAIHVRIEEALVRKVEIPLSSIAIPLEDLRGDMAMAAGGKMAHLGEVRNVLGLPTPEGFAVSSFAFKRFMEHNRVAERVKERLADLRLQDWNELLDSSRGIQKMIVEAEIPPDVKEAIGEACEALWEKIGTEREVAVRSSAISEDGEFSFAGQYATFLNVKPDEILEKYKEVISSLFTHRAIFYYKTKGYSDEEMVMAVGILPMVRARSGGVLYTRDPNLPHEDRMIVNSAWGLAKSVVDGAVQPDTFLLSRTTREVIERRIVDKDLEIVPSPGGGICETALRDAERVSPSLTDDQLKMLAGHAMAIESHYGTPQDIEWSLDEKGEIILLQARPLKVMEKTERRAVRPFLKGYRVLIDKGVIACRGVGTGRAFIVRSEEDLASFPEGGILVARHTSTRYVTVMEKAAAILTDIGGATGHMASLTREYGVPAILDTGNATSVIRHEQEITVDAINCNVYEGRVDELVEYASSRKESLKETHLYRILEKVARHTVSLTLIDPAAENFRPEGCRTFHDITRFAHEIAIAEMFGLSDTHEVDADVSVPLRAGIPLDAHLLDVGGGLKPRVKKVTSEDVMSVPFSSFLKGLRGMKWPEPRPADVRGFIGMLAHTASIPEEAIRETAEKSFAVISAHYMNFSIRLGYHFSMVEAFAGDNINENYIKFFFKGGGASRDRRLRRVRLISEVLKTIDFRVKVVEDVIDAFLPKFRSPDIEARLEVMGRLTVYTKQLDMAMFNDSITEWYKEEFLKHHVAVLHPTTGKGDV